MNLPSEETLWKTASVGLGLIIGVAILSLMHQINYLFHPVDETIISNTNSDAMADYFSNPPLLIGKFISIATAAFFSSAIAKLVKPNLTIRSAVIIGSVLMILGIFDIVTSSYPYYFKIVAPILYIPAAIFGYLFINNIHHK
ncbi:MAG: hypothetical protein JJU37_08935 [Balneolaceae bacterium]|nr:hypothetical protein [Balneolaceae bacterium]